MYYNIALKAKNTFIFIKIIICCKDEIGAGIRQSIEDGDEIRFLISTRYKYGNK